MSVKAHNVSAADLQPGLKMCDHIDSSSCNSSANGFCSPLDVTSSAGPVVFDRLNPPTIISRKETETDQTAWTVCAKWNKDTL